MIFKFCRASSLQACGTAEEGGCNENASEADSKENASFSHQWLHDLLTVLEGRKMTRSLADLDVITQDRHSFVSNWSKLLEAGLKYKESCSVLDKKQLEKDIALGWVL